MLGECLLDKKLLNEFTISNLPKNIKISILNYGSRQYVTWFILTYSIISFLFNISFL